MATLEAAARELYALAPREFVAARNRRATDAADSGDRELAKRIRALAKPSVAAWAVNMVALHREDEVDALLDIGERMREAQLSGDRESLQSLGRERHRQLAALARSARALGDDLGTPVSESAAVEVQQTYQAALADAAAAAAARSGLLVRTFSSSGLDPVELDGAVAVPESIDLPGRRQDGGGTTSTRASTSTSGRATGAATSTSRRTKVSPGEGEIGPAATARERAKRDRRQAAKREAEEARQDASDAEAELATVELRMRETVAERDRLAAELRALKAQVDEVQDALSAAESRRASLRREQVAARRTAELAQRTSARARARYDTLAAD